MSTAYKMGEMGKGRHQNKFQKVWGVKCLLEREGEQIKTRRQQEGRLIQGETFEEGREFRGSC